MTVDTLTPDHYATLLELKEGRVPFFAAGNDKDAAYRQTQIHRQLVMSGLARCRVESDAEYILLTPQGEREVAWDARN